MLLFLGFCLGMFVEWATGMGTSFGLGMYLDVPHTLPMLIGGVARDRWEDKKLQPRIDALKEKEGTTVAEKQRALILLSTFMVAAGLLTGEAFFGTESSILSFVDSLWYDDEGMKTVLGVENFADSWTWYAIRMVSLILINVVAGAAIYLLFKRAGVIGGKASEAEREGMLALAHPAGYGACSLLPSLGCRALGPCFSTSTPFLPFFARRGGSS
ncbi:MAG: hypothetical protein CM15mP78_09180 [Candidatus Poseidoniales archaeon]|nr:MAG: hypothetical protein CM15mP78_09180 [Candidatus Poseidoniales archaeon]